MPKYEILNKNRKSAQISPTKHEKNDIFNFIHVCRKNLKIIKISRIYIFIRYQNLKFVR